jgi:hypothetical protein
MSNTDEKSASSSNTEMVSPVLVRLQYRSPSSFSKLSISDSLHTLPAWNAFKKALIDAIDSGMHSSMDAKYLPLLPHSFAIRDPVTQVRRQSSRQTGHLTGQVRKHTLQPTRNMARNIRRCHNTTFRALIGSRI